MFIIALRGVNFTNAAYERIAALQTYKFIKLTKNGLKITTRVNEFLKHENKEYYLAKITLMDKYKRTKHPEVFLECLEEYIQLSDDERKILTDWQNGGHEKFRKEFSKRIIERLNSKKLDKIVIDRVVNRQRDVPRKRKVTLATMVPRSCGDVFRGVVVGVKDPGEFSVDILKRVLDEIRSLQPKYTEIKIEDRKVDEKTYVIENILEEHLEEVIRRNFKTVFPDLEIIDNGQHYYTSSGNYTDILCKDKKTGNYTVIELKRDRAPSAALIQLLDYMNQISHEFNASEAKGILICKKIDRRMLSAVEGLKSRLKDPNEIVLKEFDINLILK